MAISQKKIAQLLGVTQSTVSRALGNSPRLSPELKLRVRALCDELGYVPDFSASSLSSGRTRSISVVVASPGEMVLSDVHSKWVSSLHRAALTRSYKLRVDHLSSFERTVLEKSADGFIVFGLSGSPGSAITPAKSPVPVVFTDCVICLPQGVVATDNLGGMREAVRHLIGLGHRRIAFFGHMPYPTDSNVCLERHLGYTRAMNDAGLPAPSALTVTQSAWPAEVDDTLIYQEGLYRAIDSGATAIVASSDIAAVGAMKMLMRRGLSIPRDVSIVGFDDGLLARAWEPALTTVRQDLIRQSDTAVDMLIRAIEEGEMPSSVTVPAPLMVRGTTSSPR